MLPKRILYLVVNGGSSEKDTELIRATSAGREKYLVYTKEKEKGKKTNLMWQTKKIRTMVARNTSVLQQQYN